MTSTIEIVSDANVALKWFHAEDEEEVPEALALLDAHRARTAAISVLDLTGYEVGNALVGGRVKLDARQAMTIVQALGDICPILRPDANEWRDAGDLADHHGLTIYDAVYAAVAARRGASLVTLDRTLIDAGLGMKPSVLAARLQGDERCRQLPG